MTAFATDADLNRHNPEGKCIGGWLLIGALLVPLAIGLASWMWGRPWLNSDTATGLLAWFDWLHGGLWNYISIPDPANIAKTAHEWVSWWSPGQYVWPGLFISCGFSVGGAILFSAVVAAWIRSVGFYFFLLRLGCSANAAGLAVLVEAGNWQLFYSFGLYTGGEVLQAAWFPWLLLALSTLSGRNFLCWLVMLPVLFSVSIFVKLSMWFVLLAGATWLFWEEWHERPRRWQHLFIRGVALVLAFVVTRFLSNQWLIHNGPTPGQLSGAIRPTWLTITYPIAAPALGAAGIGSIFGRLFAILGAKAESGWQQFLPVLLFTSMVGLLAYGWLLVTLPHRKLARLLGLLLVIYIGGFIILYSGQAAVSMEERHFRPVSMLLIAGLAATICDRQSSSRCWQLILLVLAGGIVCFGLATSTQRIWHLHKMNHVGQAGYTLPDVSPSAIAALRSLDVQTADRSGVVFLPDPSLSLEISLSRKISTDAIARPLDWLTQRKWHGRVPLLTVLMPETWCSDPRRPALLACFTDYEPGEWQRHAIDGWIIFTADTPASSRR